ncbi:UNKNOWN [Stylonychia lemnae]|uniref:Mitogen-activated protein kinase n=1 Tax=Stylonychia lemnae TaxID=5949 RepID=A0A078AFY9_STYLE|nr:UNKNOWN [Stylonychia lemnae]|eukprot:CDW81215.1 UNKNOWN [Stylonychia lemnae]
MQKRRSGLNMNKFQDWEVGSNYECEKLLGTGSYGSVCMATQKSTGKKVAIKKMESIFEDEIDCKRILREITLLRKLKHPFVVELIEILAPTDPKNFNTLYTVMEYAESDLKKVIKSSIHLQLVHIQTIIYNLLCAIKYLHESNVIHRDLKPANVLVNEDCTVKLCDFGLARSIAGVESASLIIRKQSSDEIKSSSEDQEMNIAGSEPARIHHQDEVTNSTPVVEEEKKKEDLRQRLVKTKDQRRNMKRELTGHVVTRWYRAPEIILLEKDYGPAIDMWSIGCIFAELLNMMKENAPTFMDRKPLFPGKSCFPLSPDKNPQEQRKGFPHSSTDQLAVIFEVIGVPSESDRSFVTDQKAIEYLDSFPNRPKADLQSMYPGATADAIDFLQKSLVFNPYFRITLEDCFKHPFFQKVRKQEKENIAASTVVLEFEKIELDRKTLRELFLQEISFYSKKKQ